MANRIAQYNTTLAGKAVVEGYGAARGGTAGGYGGTPAGATIA